MAPRRDVYSSITSRMRLGTESEAASVLTAKVLQASLMAVISFFVLPSSDADKAFCYVLDKMLDPSHPFLTALISLACWEFLSTMVLSALAAILSNIG